MSLLTTTPVDPATTTPKVLTSAETLPADVLAAVKAREELKANREKLAAAVKLAESESMSEAAKNAGLESINLGKCATSEDEENRAITDDEAAYMCVNDCIAIMDAQLKSLINNQGVKEKAIGRVLEKPGKDTMGAVFQATCLDMNNWTRCELHIASEADHATAFKIAEIGEELFRDSVLLLKQGNPSVLVQLSYVDKNDSSIMMVANSQVRVIIDKKSLEHAAKKVPKHAQAAYLHNKTCLYVTSSNYFVTSLRNLDIDAPKKAPKKDGHNMICVRALEKALNLRIKMSMRQFYETSYITIGRAMLTHKIKAQVAANALAREKNKLPKALLVVHLFVFEERSMINRLELHDVEQVEVYLKGLKPEDEVDIDIAKKVIAMAKTPNEKKPTECVVWLQKNMAGPMSTNQLSDTVRCEVDKMEQIITAMALNTSKFVDAIDKKAVVTDLPQSANPAPAPAPTPVVAPATVPVKDPPVAPTPLVATVEDVKE
jgi:hypothetical protein